MKTANQKPLPIPEPRISRFEDFGFGLFLHWGLYSQVSQGCWIRHLKPSPSEEYVKLKTTFTAADFKAADIAQTARRAGMKYIVLTTRHHEGFSLYDTRGLSDFDAPHPPAGRDLVAEFVQACRAEQIVPFFYHTTLDWHWRGQKTAELSEGDFNEYLDYPHRCHHHRARRLPRERRDHSQSLPSHQRRRGGRHPLLG
ncbi:MAG: alpha-L-fucosidase [Spartobacteria bacterium]